MDLERIDPAAMRAPADDLVLAFHRAVLEGLSPVLRAEYPGDPGHVALVVVRVALTVDALRSAIERIGKGDDPIVVRWFERSAAAGELRAIGLDDLAADVAAARGAEPGRPQAVVIAGLIAAVHTLDASGGAS